MTKMMFRIATLILALATTQTILHAQERESMGMDPMLGTWDVHVTVVDCNDGHLIRTVRALQLFSRDGSFSETASTYLRGSSVGTWSHGDHRGAYVASYWFFRYNTDGTPHSIAEGLNSMTLGEDGKSFTAKGTITDSDLAGNLISVGCVTHAATRLSGPGR